jgi:putative endopeptidase
MTMFDRTTGRTARIALVLLATCALPGAAMAQAAPPPAAAASPMHYGAWGVDLGTRDMSVKPGDDFQRYASGKWLDANPVPADKPGNGTGLEVYERTQDELRTIITEAPKDSQLGALYASWMDQPLLEKVGDKPLKASLAKVDAIKTKAAFTRFMGETSYKFGASLFAPGVIPDPNNPTMNVVSLRTAGLGLPDRDYYLLDKYKEQREAYRQYIIRSLKLIGDPSPITTANRILAFETAFAKLSWPRTDLRNIEKTNNHMTPAALAAYAPGVDWSSLLTASGIPSQDEIVVRDNSAVKALAALYRATPLSTLKAWQKFKVTDQAAGYMSAKFEDNRFEFDKAMSGVKEQRPRWRRGIDQVDNRLGELLGKTFVDRYFTQDAKAKMESLVGNLKLAAAARIKGNSWMSDPTKQAALVKLGKMQVMVGYPEKFRDYSALTMRPDDLYGNVERSSAFEWNYELSQLGKPVDKTLWGMSPATVDAYNSSLENKIVFPAGILQAPLFDPAADPAVNYGAIGAVIGHEIRHGFDDQGRKFDETGKARDWWTAADAERFKALTDELGKQYSSYEPAPGVFINGALTMGENIGDMSGLQVAYDAYQMSLGGKPAPVIDGLTGDQRFFLSFAQAWRGNQRPESIKTQVASDPHSPRRFRVIGPLRNLDAWYKAFDIQPGSKFYIPPEKRVRLW